MNKVVVAIINRCTRVPDDDVVTTMKALQVQVSRDFAPVWGTDADLIFMKDPTAPVPPEAWLLYNLDNSDQAGALGYHDLGPNGKPIGKSFAGTDIEYGEQPSITLSHELLELLADPWCNSLCAVNYRGQRVITLKEVCDAVEDDSCGYEIEGVRVSDFVYPAYFQTDAPIAGQKLDHTGMLRAPMTIARGGYLSIKADDGKGWQQVLGQHVPMHKRMPPRGSRRERFLLRENHRRSWIASAKPTGGN